MVLDKDGGIHIAYYGAKNGDLKYEYLTSYTDGTADVCTVDSFLWTKTGFERFLNKRKFEKTHLPTLCRKYSIEAEVWTSCGEAGYDEHFVIGYDGKVLAKESFDTTPNCACCEPDWKPGREEAEWSANWGKWVIPLRSEYEARKLALQKHRNESTEALPF